MNIFKRIARKIKKAINKPIEIDVSLKVEGAYNSELKRKLTICINGICEKYKTLKIGETGNYKVRACHVDYSKYKKMYVLYSSENKEQIDELEIYYIEKFQGKFKNKRNTKTKDMISADGLYHLYLVAR